MADANIKNTHYGHKSIIDLDRLLKRINRIHNLLFLGARFDIFFTQFKRETRLNIWKHCTIFPSSQPTPPLH